MFFFMVNHYLYCKKYNINFKLNTSNWVYLYKDGWIDYFENFDLILNNEINILECFHGKILENFKLYEYKNAIKEIYKYNDLTKHKINEIKEKYNLFNNKYSSIFIRRGDKLFYESLYYNSELYIKLLLEKDPECDIIFIQTDDYNVFIDLEEYIIKNKLNIKLITLCDKNIKGMLVAKLDINTIHAKNIDYFLSIKKDLQNTKIISEMNKIEIYQHTIDMIIGLDIVLHSNFCITDYQSNVSRFIKLAHNNFHNVYTIEYNYINLNDINCPSYLFNDDCCII